MPRSAPIQNTFNGGEISPQMEGRSDLDRYGSSVSVMDNFIALPGGSTRRRPGSRFVEQVKNSSSSMLLPFQSTDGTRYILELGAGFIRVYKNQALVAHPDLTFTNADVDDTDTDEITIFDKSYWEGQIVRFTDGGGGLPSDGGSNLAEGTDYYVRLAQPITFNQSHIVDHTDSLTSGGTIDSINLGGAGSSGTPHELSNRMGPYVLSFVPSDLTATVGFLPNLKIGAMTWVDETSVLWYIERINADEFGIRPDDPAAARVWFDTFGNSTSGSFVLTPTLEYQRDKFRLSTSPSSAPIDLTSAGGAGPHTISPSTSAGDQTNPPLEIVTPYIAGDFTNGIDWARTERQLILVTRDIQPYVLTNLSDTEWRLDPLEFLDGPYQELREGDTTTNLAKPTTFAITGRGAANDTNPPFEVGDGQARITAINPIFTLANIGQLVRMDTGDPAADPNVSWGWGIIVGITSDLIAHVEIRGDIVGDPAGTPTEKWHLGVFQPHVGKWPDVVGLFEQRLAVTGGEDRPSHIYSSRTGSFNDWSPTDIDAVVPDDAALSFHIVSNEPNRIQWISTVRVPALGTEDGIYVLQASAISQAISPTNLTARLQSAFGASKVRPVRVDDALLYVGRTRESVRMLAFNFEQDAFAATDVGIFATHLVHERESGRIEQMAYAQEPDGVIWIRQEAGQLIGLTLRREQSVIAWHRHTVGGAGSDIQEMAVLQEEAYDQLWMIHKIDNGSERRNINIWTDHHVEGLDLPDRWGATPDIASTFFLDAAKYFGAVSTVSDLDHLEGQSATAIYEVATGGLRIESGLTVSGGAVTLNETAVKGYVGLPYTSRLESLPVVSGRGGLRAGSDRGLLANIDRVIVSLDRTIGGQAGDSANNLKELPHPIAPMDNHPLFFQGEHRIEFSGDWTRQLRLVVHQPLPYPMTVRWWAPQYRQSER